jgi:hypothetical protein
MTRVRRARGIAALLTTMAAVALATTAQGDAHANTTTDTGRSAPAKVSIRLHIAGCDHCQVQLQHAITRGPKVWTSKQKTVGADHVVRYRVRRSLTHGMSFVLRAPWEGNTGAVPNMVTRYAGHAVDTFVSRHAARHADRAEGCWAGASTDAVRLSFRVARVPARTLDGHRTHVPLAYATHSMSSWKPAVSTFKGTIGNQDAFYCSTPKTTKLTLAAPGCNGCEIGVMNGARRIENTWAAEPKKVAHGEVTFRVPRPATRGLTATVTAPWEGTTGYTTVVAFRYAHHRSGDAVTFADARSQTRGTPCWGGTHRADLTLPLTVRQVRVGGTTGPTAGSIAYVDDTQSWLKPMMHAGKGVLGSQEVITCRK